MEPTYTKCMSIKYSAWSSFTCERAFDQAHASDQASLGIPDLRAAACPPPPPGLGTPDPSPGSGEQSPEKPPLRVPPVGFCPGRTLASSWPSS